MGHLVNGWVGRGVREDLQDRKKGVGDKFYATGHGKRDRSNYLISNRLEMLLTTSNRVKHNGHQR